MGYAENFIQAFQIGTQIRQNQERQAHEAERLKLEKEAHRQRIRQLDMGEKLQAWELKNKQYDMMSGQPASSYQQAVPGQEMTNLGGFPENGVPGGAPITGDTGNNIPSPIAGPSVGPESLIQRVFQRPSVQYPGIEELGQEGFSRPVETLEEQLMKLRATAAARSTTGYQSIRGRDAQGNPVFGRFSPAEGTITNEQGQPIPGLQPYEAVPSAGVDLNRAAQAAGFRTFMQVPDELKAQVQDLAMEMTQGLSYSRRLGTGQGALDSPVTPQVSQSTQLPVGAAGSDFTGQTVPTEAQNQMRRTGEVLMGDLKRLTEGGLLDILPRQAETVGGMLPGAVYQYRKRTGDGRVKAAQLESVVQGMVNDLARYKGQRGAQTEGDVERAYQSLVSLQTSLTDALTGGGDTYESALARIQQAEAGLKIVAGTITPAPVARPATTPGTRSASPATPPPAGATGPTGITIGPDGKLYRNGKPIG